MSGLAAHLPVLPVVVPLLTAPLTMLLDGRRAWMAAVAAAACTLGVACFACQGVLEQGALGYALGAWPAPYGIELRVDALSALVLLIVAGAATAGLLIAGPGMDASLPDRGRNLYYGAWLLALAGLCGIAVSADAFNVFVFMEISSLAGYVLVGGGRDRRALTASFRYLVMGTLGATSYLVGVGLIYLMTGTLNLDDMARRLGSVDEAGPVLLAGGFVTVGLAIKAAVFPLHGWLPAAYTHAPHAVTVFMAACTTKVMLYVLLRFDFLVFHEAVPGVGVPLIGLLVPLAAAAALVASWLAVTERDLKRLLAYSSVAQIGYVLIGAGLDSVTGVTAGVVHLFNHALAKGALFLAAASLAAAGGGLALADLRGAARRRPWTLAAFVLAGLSLIGIPGTAGFVTKWYLVLAGLEAGPPGIAAVAAVLVSSVLAVVYLWRVVEAAYFGEASVGQTPSGEAAGKAAPGWPVGVLWVAAAANVYFGLRPQLPLGLAREAAALLAGSP